MNISYLDVVDVYDNDKRRQCIEFTYILCVISNQTKIDMFYFADTIMYNICTNVTENRNLQPGDTIHLIINTSGIEVRDQVLPLSCACEIRSRTQVTLNQAIVNVNSIEGFRQQCFGAVINDRDCYVPVHLGAPCSRNSANCIDPVNNNFGGYYVTLSGYMTYFRAIWALQYNIKEEHFEDDRSTAVEATIQLSYSGEYLFIVHINLFIVLTNLLLLLSL